jgi:hypothetical protein
LVVSICTAGELVGEQHFAALPVVLRPLGKCASADGDLLIHGFHQLVPGGDFRGARRGDVALLRFQPFFDVERRVDHGLQLVVIALRERLELVVVAAGALHGDAEQRRAENLQRPFQHGVLVRTDFVRVAVAAVGPVGTVPQEMDGFQELDHLRPDVSAAAITGEFIPRDLLAQELVPRLVGVDRAKDVIAIAIRQRPVGVGPEVTVAVGVARRVEPVFAPPFAVALGVQKPFDHPFIGVRLLVGEKLVDLLYRRRQAGEIETHAANQRFPIRLRADRQTGGFQFRLKETVDRRLDLRFVPHGRNRNVAERLESPVFVAVRFRGDLCRQAARAGFDPAAQNGFVVVRQRLLGGHLIGGDALPEQALVGLAGNDRRALFAAALDGRRQRETKLAFPLRRAVTLHATELQDRRDVFDVIGNFFVSPHGDRLAKAEYQSQADAFFRSPRPRRGGEG